MVHVAQIAAPGIVTFTLREAKFGSATQIGDGVALTAGHVAFGTGGGLAKADLGGQRSDGNGDLLFLSLMNGGALVHLEATDPYVAVHERIRFFGGQFGQFDELRKLDSRAGVLARMEPDMMPDLPYVPVLHA